MNDWSVSLRSADDTRRRGETLLLTRSACDCVNYSHINTHTPALWVLVPVVHEAFRARDRSQFGHQVMIVSLDDERPLFLHLKTTQTHFIYLYACIWTIKCFFPWVCKCMYKLAYECIVISCSEILVHMNECITWIFFSLCWICAGVWMPLVLTTGLASRT